LVLLALSSSSAGAKGLHQTRHRIAQNSYDAPSDRDQVDPRLVHQEGVLRPEIWPPESDKGQALEALVEATEGVG
jgi:hypothetical protein